MRNGFTLTAEYLTYDRREPTVYDRAYWPEGIDPLPCWVLRQYGTILATRPSSATGAEPPKDWLREIHQFYGATVNATDPDWIDYLLLADQLHAAYVTAQTESLPIIVRRRQPNGESLWASFDAVPHAV